MGQSFTRDVGTGSKTVFLFSFDGPDNGYESADDIKVYVNGTPTSYTLSGPTQVTISPAPASGAEVLIRREVLNTSPFADYVGGNVFNELSLNGTFRQELYVSQELRDGFKPTGYKEQQDLDMGVKQVKNLAPGTEADDAVTVQQVITYVDAAGDFADQAAASAASAASSASTATTKAAEAAVSEFNAAQDADDAQISSEEAAVSAGQASGSASAASTSESNALAYGTAALGYRNEAEGFKNTASTKADEAAASALAASISESNAASDASDASDSADAAAASAASITGAEATCIAAAAAASSDADDASDSALEASGFASAASDSATAASGSASAASSSANSANNSAIAAAGSASAASGSASAASTSASNASTSESNAASSASAASTSASDASGYAANALSSANAASSSASDAADSADEAAASADEINRINIAVIGDSLTQPTIGYGSWPDELKKLTNQMGFNINIKNYAIGGATFLSANTVDDHQNGTRTQVEQCIAQGADIILVCLGVNDSGDSSTIYNYSKNVYDTLHAGLPSAKIVLMEELVWDWDTQGGYTPATLKNKYCIPFGHTKITYNTFTNSRVNNTTYLDTNIGAAFQSKIDTLGPVYSVANAYYDDSIKIKLFKIYRMGFSQDGLHPDEMGHRLIAYTVFKWLAENNDVDNNILRTSWVEQATNEYFDVDDLYYSISTGDPEPAEYIAAYFGCDIWNKWDTWFYLQRNLIPYIGPQDALADTSNVVLSLHGCRPNADVALAWGAVAVPLGQQTSASGKYNQNLVPKTLGLVPSIGTYSCGLGIEVVSGEWEFYLQDLGITSITAEDPVPGEYFFQREGISTDSQTTSTTNGFINLYLTTEVEDPKGISASTGFTAPYDGFYALTAFCGFNGVDEGSVGSIGFIFAINGASGTHRQEIHVPEGVNSTNIQCYNLSQALHLSAGDVVLPKIEKWGAGSLTSIGTRCFFSGYAISFD